MKFPSSLQHIVLFSSSNMSDDENGASFYIDVREIFPDYDNEGKCKGFYLSFLIMYFQMIHGLNEK